jgi:transposase
MLMGKESSCITGGNHRSDLTDKDWAVAAPFVPPPHPGGRPRATDMREVLNAILYMAGGGIPWRMLPKDFPPVSTVRGYFYTWCSGGTLVLYTRSRSLNASFGGTETNI